jgi:hypothetical protein
MSRSRYTINSILEEINECRGHIYLAMKKEDSAYDQFTGTIYEMRHGHVDNAEWDFFIQNRAKSRYKNDEKYYHECARKRMKLKKQYRLLTIRLNKLQNVLFTTNSYKLLVMNHVDGLDIDILKTIKILIFALLDANTSYYL